MASIKNESVYKNNRLECGFHIVSDFAAQSWILHWRVKS